MNLEHLYAAVELVRNDCYRDSSREATRLRTYPIMVAAAAAASRTETEGFLRTACLAYAWIPQRIQLAPDPTGLTPAVEAFAAARADPESGRDPHHANLDAAGIEAIAASLGSLVGAALVLHLANPAVFPIWDERIEEFRLGEVPSPYHMAQVRHYLSFIADIRELARHPLFLTFHNEFCTAYQARLQRLRIPHYPLTEPKVVEAAIMELAET